MKYSEYKIKSDTELLETLEEKIAMAKDAEDRARDECIAAADEYLESVRNLRDVEASCPDFSSMQDFSAEMDEFMESLNQED